MLCFSIIIILIYLGTRLPRFDPSAYIKEKQKRLSETKRFASVLYLFGIHYAIRCLPNTYIK